MKIPEAIKQAVETKNAYMVGDIADQLGYRCKMNYDQTYELFHKHTQISKARFDELLYESERDQGFN